MRKMWMMSLSVGTCWFASACVTGGSNDAGTMIGVVAVYSTVAQSSQSGEEKSLSLWCDVLHSVDRMLHDTSEQEILPSERQSLVLEIEPKARNNGFRLHAIQINQLIDDAKAVLTHKDARTTELSRCDRDKTT